jgi:hypothetical protein
MDCGICEALYTNTMNMLKSNARPSVTAMARSSTL